jgi:hypothetical protein
VVWRESPVARRAPPVLRGRWPTSGAWWLARHAWRPAASGQALVIRGATRVSRSWSPTTRAAWSVAGGASLVARARRQVTGVPCPALGARALVTDSWISDAEAQRLALQRQASVT